MLSGSTLCDIPSTDMISPRVATHWIACVVAVHTSFWSEGTRGYTKADI